MKKSILDQFASDAINAPAAVTGGGGKKGKKSKSGSSKSGKSGSSKSGGSKSGGSKSGSGGGNCGCPPPPKC